MERSFWSTIGGKLLSRTLAVVLIPVLTIGGVAIASMQSLSGTADEYVTAARSALSDDVVGSQVADVSEQIARQIAIFLDERVADTQALSRDVGLITAANAAGGRAAVRGLPDMSIDELEADFADNPRLSDVHAERDLLNAIESTPAFKEISLTDVNGFNVDYSSPPSDFVQSDEDWWISAMDNGLDISAPEFNATTGVFAMNIAIRLDRDDRAVGVLKAALDIQVIQLIADQFAGGADALDVTIVDSNGLFLAETASSHEASHIMNPIYLASSLATTSEFVREVFETNSNELHPDGFSISDTGVGGYAEIADELDALRGEMQSELSAFDWTVVVEQPSEVAFASLGPLEGLAGQVSSTSLRLSILLVLVAGIGALAAGYVATLFGRRLTSPITLLRDAAVKTAEITLPNVVAQIDTLEPDEELPELERLTLETGDEVEDLAESFNTVQQTAANLASGQARMRRKNVATTFVNLGRRNQNLLSRQLEHINSMEDNETNSDTLHRLFQLDHLATRMRRNAESLLVLAGEETPRRFRQPVTMHQLVQAAGGEIEDFDRIEITTLDDTALEGAAASDVAHLLAELLENASAYSPPGVPIQVHGRRRQNGYALSIVDQGIGMEEDDLAAANERLADPAEFDRAPSAYLGHFVVGHLAKRHDIRVQLTDSPYAGVAAQIHLPSTLLASPAEVPVAPGIDEIRTSDIYSEADAELTESERSQIEAIELALFADAPAAVGSVGQSVASEPAFAEPFADVSPDQTAASEPAFAEPFADFSPDQTAASEPAIAEPFADLSPDQTAASEPAIAEPFADLSPDQTAASEPAFPQQFADVSPDQAAGAEPAFPQQFADVSAVEDLLPIVSTVAPDLSPVEHAAAPTLADTTPSGFRRRRRGEEGAPESLAPSTNGQPTGSRRSPEEVQASLQRFRRGVEAGRAQSAENNHHHDQGFSGGDTQ